MMSIQLTHISDLQKIDRKNKTLGFGPTMGALHQGHLSLIERSLKECDITVCSLFVNPTQFNDSSDYDKYPRTLEKDLELLEKVGCHYAFIPSKEEMYPEEDKRQFNFGHLEQVMEGAHRQGHFNGVAQIVSKLFDAVKPDKAYFGEKDFQQLAIIRDLVKQLDLDIEIVGCSIIREPDGLAMSSRNTRLSSAQREEAVLISRTLRWVKLVYSKKSLNEIRDEVKQKFEDSNLELEYFEIADEDTLQSINTVQPKNSRAFIAAFCGDVRLIDNMKLS